MKKFLFAVLTALIVLLSFCMVGCKNSSPSNNSSAPSQTDSSQDYIYSNIAKLFNKNLLDYYVTFKDFTGKEPSEDIPLTITQTKNLLKISYDTIWLPLGKPWDIKKNHELPDYQYIVESEGEKIILNLCGILGNEGYIAIIKDGDYWLYKIDSENYNTLQSMPLTNIP